MKGQWMAPVEIVWQNWAKSETATRSGFFWTKFGEVIRGDCLYAGYENNIHGEDFPGGFLYLRFSLKDGRVTGVKMTPDCLEAVSLAWNDYDTPRASMMGWASRYIREIMAFVRDDT